MPQEPELPSGLSIKDLSPEDVFKLIDSQNNSSRLEILTNLYSRKPELSNFLQQSYGLNPEQFSRLVSGSFAPLTTALPKEYVLDVDFILDNSLSDDEKSLGANVYIISSDVYKNAKMLTSEQSQRKDTYEDFVQRMRDRHTLMGENMHPVGAFGFRLYREKVDGMTIDDLVSTGTRIRPRKDFWWLSQDEENQIIPVPLRWSEGSRLGISDKIREGEESLLQQISQKDNTFGISATTSPSSEGEKMLARHGYFPSDDLSFNPRYSSFRPILEKSLIYRPEYNWQYKIINLPQKS